MERSLKSDARESLLGTGRFARAVGLCLLGGYLVSGIYSVSPNEIGVVQRFGRMVAGDVRPGIHWAFPWPIDTISRVPVREIRRVSLDDFSEGGTHAEAFTRLTGLAPGCLTGDNNIVTLNCVIQYAITGPAEYLFHVARAEDLFHDLAASALLECLVSMPVDEILTFNKTRIEADVKKDIQERMDRLRTGISVTFVEMRDVRAPWSVQGCFDDVIKAKLDMRNRIAMAESYRNEQLPHAHALADRMVQDAHAYTHRAVAMAEGDAHRFLSRLKEYERDPAAVRERLLLDFLGRIHPRLDRLIVVDEKGGPLRIYQPDVAPGPARSPRRKLAEGD